MLRSSATIHQPFSYATVIWNQWLQYEEMPRIIVKAIFAPNYCHFCFTNNFGISQPIPARVVSID